MGSQKNQSTPERPRDLSLITKGEVKAQGSGIVADIPKLFQFVVKGSKNGDEPYKAAKEFSSCDTNSDRTADTLKRLLVISEEMEFNRICILKSLSKTQLLIGQIEAINDSVTKRTNSN